MGQAFNQYGDLLGEAEGDSRTEVLRNLERRFPDAEEMRIKIARVEEERSKKEQDLISTLLAGGGQ